MKRLLYKNSLVTVNELAEMSGVAPATIRDRLRRGYSVEQAIRSNAVNDSVQAFIESSWYKDWIGMSTTSLHEIYWKWCVSHGYTPLQKQGFMRHILMVYPNLKTVPTRKGAGCCRMIREK